MSKRSKTKKPPAGDSVRVPIQDEDTWRAIERRAMKAGYTRHRRGVLTANMSAYMRDLAAGNIDTLGRKRKAGAI